MVQSKLPSTGHTFKDITLKIKTSSNFELSEQLSPFDDSAVQNNTHPTSPTSPPYQDYITLDDYNSSGDEFDTTKDGDGRVPRTLASLFAAASDPVEEATSISANTLVTTKSANNVAAAILQLITDSINRTTLYFFICGIGKSVKGFVRLLTAIIKSSGRDIYIYVVDKSQSRVNELEVLVNSLNANSEGGLCQIWCHCADIVFQNSVNKIMTSANGCANIRFDVMVTFCRGLSSCFYHKLLAITLAAGISFLVAPRQVGETLHLQAVKNLKPKNTVNGFLNFAQLAEVSPNKPQKSVKRSLGYIDLR